MKVYSSYGILSTMKNICETNFKKEAEIFKALSNPVRLEVLECLFDGEKCVCEIISKLNKYEQAHISKSLIKLKQAGILKDRKEGLNVYYSIAMPCIIHFISCLKTNM